MEYSWSRLTSFLKVWGEGGPNPPKVAIILEELGLPYEFVPIAMADVKKPEYLAINPNGRLPAIYDPNTNITLWESGGKDPSKADSGSSGPRNGVLLIAANLNAYV